MSTTVTYKNETLATVSNNTKTLKTAGKYMEDDVVLTDVSASLLQAKTYTVDSAGTTTVTADSGYDGLSSVSVSVPSAEPWVGIANMGFYTDSNNRRWRFRSIVEFSEGEQVGWMDADTFGDYWSVPAVTSGTTITPTETAQTIGGTNYMMEGAVTVNAIPSDYVGSGITRRSSSDLTKSGGTVIAPRGYYSSDATTSVGTALLKQNLTILETGATLSADKSLGVIILTKDDITIRPSVQTEGYVSTQIGTHFTDDKTDIQLRANCDINPDLTENNGVVTAPSGYYTTNRTKAVTSGTAGTPIATKGAVSNHSVSVTPSVTNTTGYITGSTKTGTAVTVSASELVSGNLPITQNGNNIDCTNYSTVSVNVSGGGGSSMQIDTIGPPSSITSSTLTFTGLSGEPTSFMVYADEAITTSASPKVASVVFDGTSLHGQIVTNTSNAQASYDTGFTKSYSNGTLTITSTNASFISVEHYLTYTYGGGAVDTKDVQVGSGATSITFTGLEDEPVLWSCIFKSNFSTSNGYQRVMAVGETANGTIVGFAMDSSAHCNSAYWTASYNNGSFTITSQGTNAGGYFHQPGYYQLTYAVDNGGGGGGNYQTKTVTPTTSQQVITADTGYDALSQVTVNAMATGTAGTPTATKGTVSNHAVSVTPSVTNTTGYITGSTKTGTAVTVSASELVSGTKSITSNGTGIDVTNYASVTVNVPTGGGSGLVYESGTWTPSADTADYTISFTSTHTTAPFFYVIIDSEGDYYTGANSNIQVRFVCSSLLGVDLYITETNVQYATIVSQYRGTSTTSFSTNSSTLTTNSSVVLSDYATSTGIRAYTNATSRYWRAGRAYKWIAVWAPTT